MTAFKVIRSEGSKFLVQKGENTAAAAASAAMAVAAAASLAAAGINPDATLHNYLLFGAGNTTLTGTHNFCEGPQAGETLGSGSRNNLRGFLAGRDIGAGSDNIIEGYLAAFASANIQKSVVIGSEAMTKPSDGISDAIAIGFRAMRNGPYSESIGIGSNTLTDATGGPSTVVGTNAGAATTTGNRQTLFGFNAQGGAANDDVIAFGHNVSATRSKQIVLGTGTQEYLRLFGLNFARWDANGFNAWLLDDGPATLPTGTFNLSLGRGGLNSVTSGDANLGICEGALELQQTGDNTLAIGVNAAQLGNALFDCTYIGVKTGRFNLFGTGATAVGFRAMEHNAVAGNNCAYGDSALWHSQGLFNTVSGYTVAEAMSVGDENVANGFAAMRYRDSGSQNVFAGAFAGAITSNAPNTDFTVGQNGDVGGVAAGDRSTGMGHRVLEEFLGSDATAVGCHAGRKMVGLAGVSYDAIFIGARSGDDPNQKPDAFNSIAIGAGTYTTADNQVVLGNPANDNFTFGATTFSAAELASLKALVA